MTMPRDSLLKAVTTAAAILSPSSSVELESNSDEGELDYMWNRSDYYDGAFLDRGDSNLIALLYLSYMPLCCIVGLTGNCMVLILIRSNRIFRKLPSSVFLLALAVMSSLFLVSLLSFWIEEGFISTGERHSAILCKFSTFLAHFCDFSSVWLIVLVGVERVSLLSRLHFSKHIVCCRFRRTLSNAHKQVAIIMIFTLICNGWILFVAGINPSGGCDIDPDYDHLYGYFSIFETISCMIVPTVMVVICNVLIVIQLRKYLKQGHSSPTVSFHTADTIYSSGPSQTIRSIKLSKASASRCSLTNETVQTRYKRHSTSLRFADIQLTRSLMVITTVFIVLNLPNYMYRIAIQFLNISDQSEFMQRLSFAAHVLLYTHHAILFYLYIFYSPQMKKRLVPTALKLLECYCLKHVHDDSYHGVH